MDSNENLTKTIDNKNPFDNITEYREYNSDYSEVVPQINIPGCRIPFVPSKEEKRSIRRFYNIAGGGLAIHYLSAVILGNVLTILASMILKWRDSSLGELPAGYSDIANDYLSKSSIQMGCTALVYLLCNVLVFVLGSRVSKVKLGTYFQTQNLSGGKLIRYIGVGAFLQIVSAYLVVLIDYLTNGSGLTDVGADFYNGDNIHMIIVTVLYTCIIAPITEELLYRGFVMKNLSRVSQRFGIFMSAFLFGLAHGNVQQFVLAFILGIFLGYIDTKHNSLVPSMIVHAVVNTVSTVEAVTLSFDEMTAMLIAVLFTLTALAGGGTAFVFTVIKEHLPFTTPHQKIRGGRIAATSWGLISAVVIMIGFYIFIMMLTSATSALK